MPCAAAVVVHNQGELDQAISDGYTEIVINPDDETAKLIIRDAYIESKIRVFRVLGGRVETSETVSVVASGTAVVDARGLCAVMSLERSLVNAYENVKVTACDDSFVNAYDGSRVVTFHNAEARCFDLSKAYAMGSRLPVRKSDSCTTVFFASSRAPAASPEPESDPVPAVVFDGPEELLFDDA